MLELDDALARILACVPAPVGEAVPLKDAYRRVLTESLSSPIDLPPFDNSAMDGYAVRSEDVKAAKADAPVRLRLQGRIAAGQHFEDQVPPGGCVRLFTGSALPRGADAVIMQEDTQTAAANPGEVLMLDSAKPWENVRLRGEDVKRGTTLVEGGKMLTATRLSLLAATGIAEVSVGRRPIIGLLATGSELQAGGSPLAQGQIYESNVIGLAAMVGQAGGVARTFAAVADVLSATNAAMNEALSQCDAVITSGGVSVGEFDLVKAAFEEVGGQLDFWKVAIKPGRPFVLGRCGRKLLFGLPGNPVSALVTFLLLVRPAILKWQGATELALPTIPAILAEPLVNRGERTHFVRVTIDRQGQVRSTGVQASHILSSLAAANGLVNVPPRGQLEAGQTVRVLLFE